MTEYKLWTFCPKCGDQIPVDWLESGGVCAECGYQIREELRLKEK